LVQSGLVAVSVTLDRTPRTCVELVAAGTLIEVPANAGLYSFSYQAISSVNLLEVPPGLLQGAIQRQPALRRAYDRQLHWRVMQVQLVAACNAHHSVARRCARWLLRQAHLGPVLPVTHALPATMLGARRAGISTTLEELQRRGVVRQCRGSIEILDGVALGAAACSCPDSDSCPENAISADLIDGDVIGDERARAWLEREINVQAAMAVPGDERRPRRQAALRLCQNILAQGLTAFEQGTASVST